ncbi:UDP-N-acetylmuramate dehydrogenase [Nakamurella silvestris]|nr:UDP-N-acetylmuramate dehydrogenase [Nakamurella silvestris]
MGAAQAWPSPGVEYGGTVSDPKPAVPAGPVPAEPAEPSAAPVLLADHTTFGLGGPAADFRTATSVTELVEAVTSVDAAGAGLLLIAGGSNLVVADAGVACPVVKIATRGVRAVPDGDDLLVTVAAGENFDAVVAQFSADGWSGIEFLSGIPGSAGATPIQNVGAYGAEISQVLHSVEVLRRRDSAGPGIPAAPGIPAGPGALQAARPGEVITLPAAELGLAYRSSILRGTDRAVVLSVTIRLTRRPNTVRYGELATALGLDGGGSAPPQQVREAVLALRRGKGMVWDPADPDTRSAGSFFTNPILADEDAAVADQAIRAALGEVTYPRYPAGPGDPGAVKLSAAWLIERAGFGKGFHLPGRSGAQVSDKHTLALTNRGGTTADLLELARHIRDGVDRTFAVRLHPEPILVGVTFDG